MPAQLFRIVLRDIPDPRGADKPPLFRRGQKLTSKKRPRAIPPDCCTPRMRGKASDFFLIDSFDAINFKHFTLIRVGSPDDKSPRISRDHLDVYGPELGDERRHAIVVRLRPDHSGMFVQEHIHA